jgi:uncharacterized damage-inducible protein DinB
MPLAEIESRFQAISARRQEFIDQERSTNWTRVIHYKDLRGNEHSRALNGLLLHVANHGIHHRSQALNYLKQFGRTAVIGLDYLFYKMAFPSVPQLDETIEARRKQGIDYASGPGVAVIWDRSVIERYFAYHDWAIDKLFDLATPLTDDALDRDFHMGLGSIRMTLNHLHDVEQLWFRNWQQSGPQLSPMTAATPLAQLRQSWAELAQKRNGFIAQVDADLAASIVNVSFGGPVMKFQMVESIIQVCVHGTHHRAQLINMLRHCGLTMPGFDLVLWLKEIGL